MKKKTISPVDLAGRDSQIYSAHTGQPFYGIPVFMDDFKCTENKNGDYGCIGLFSIHSSME